MVDIDLTAGAPDPRYVTYLGDRREVSVPCWSCRTPTLALDGTCDRCHGALAGRRARVA